MMEPNDRCYDVVDMAEAHERGTTMKNLCPCCGAELVTKLACPIGCPGPESGTKWKRSNRGRAAEVKDAMVEFVRAESHRRYQAGDVQGHAEAVRLLAALTRQAAE